MDLGFEIRPSDGFAHLLAMERPCFMAQGLISFPTRGSAGLPGLSQAGGRGRGDILVSRMSLQFWGKIRARRQQRGTAHTELRICRGFPLPGLGLCPYPHGPRGRL